MFDYHDVFISYHSRDHETAQRIGTALRNHGLRAFLDRWYLTPGLTWPQELERMLGSCGSVVVLVGPGEMGAWQQREVDFAIDRQAHDAKFPVIPILLPGADPMPGFLGQNTWIDLRNPVGDGELLGVLVRAIRGQPPGPDVAAQLRAAAAQICPYRGLLSFREEDAAFFYGREAAIEQLTEIVQRNSFVDVVGASGSGKSSLVRAGLVSRLRRARKIHWDIVTMVPGNAPFAGLAGAILDVLEPQMTETDRLLERAKLADALCNGQISVGDVARRVLEKQRGTDRLLLVVDQWEELYTLTSGEPERRAFIDALLDASARSPLYVTFTLRGDFFGHVTSHRRLADRLQGSQLNLGPMTRTELDTAISGPAKTVHLQFDPGLTIRILNDVGDEVGNLRSSSLS